MDWAFVFSAVNMIALGAWVLLVFLPRWPALLALTLYLGVGMLCAIYGGLLIAVLSGAIPSGESGADFSSIEGVRAIFASDVGVVIGWTHYLAFDLFVGLWIARDGDAKQISRFIQAPILFATLMAGPLGLVLWLLLREPAARRQGRFD